MLSAVGKVTFCRLFTEEDAGQNVRATGRGAFSPADFASAAFGHEVRRMVERTVITKRLVAQDAMGAQDALVVHHLHGLIGLCE
jgi:hypothetical protein